MHLKIDRAGRLALGALLVVVASTHLAWAGQVELVSRIAPEEISDTASGSLLGGPDRVGTFVASLSADGRYMAFTSPATNLLAGVDDTNATNDLFVRDRLNGTTILVSRSMTSPDVPSNGTAAAAVLSADGRYVAWTGAGTDVAPGTVAGTFPQRTLFLFDRLTGTNRLVLFSPALLNRPVARGASPLAFSPDDRFLLFSTDAPDVLPDLGANGGFVNAFLYDLASGTISLVSHEIGFPQKPMGGFGARMSRDGTTIAFASRSGHLWVFDLASGALEDIGPGIDPALSRFDHRSSTAAPS